jgi:hypothetical protein
VICFDGRVLAPASPAVRRTGPATWAVTLLAGLLLAALAPLPAPAASAASQLADQVRRADAVFTGTVTHASTARKSGGQRGASTTYDVDVQRVYKGHVREQSVQVVADASKRSCRLGALDSGHDYVFLVTETGDGLTTDGCSGTASAGDKLVGDVEKLLGSGRPPVPPAPTKASFTTVEHAQPTTFTRLAAPGVAAVLVGLLGLVVVRRLARRS